MAITRIQKEKILEQGKIDISDSKILLFADFKGTKVEEMKGLRKALRGLGITFRVAKKRLLRIILKNEGIDFDPVKLDGQVGVAFAKHDISEVAQPVYKFSKNHGTFKIIGGVDVIDKKEIPLEIINRIGNLPSREVLLASFINSLISPLRGFMHVLSEKSKNKVD
jgi:large subunit ribosomal protein L10